jgi:hypothetical protein
MPTSGWGRIYAALFRVFGPAQLGDPAEPPPLAPPPAAPCPRCGKPLAQHAFTASAGRRRMRCPE